MSTNALGNMLGVHASPMPKWIRRYTTARVEKLAPSGKVVIMDWMEMWHFLHKNGVNSGSGRLLMVIQANSCTRNVGVVMQNLEKADQSPCAM
jgi:hypothetical protein